MRIFPFLEDLSSKEMINFSGIDEYQGVAKSIHQKLFQIKQIMVQLRIHYVCTEMRHMKHPLFQKFHIQLMMKMS